MHRARQPRSWWERNWPWAVPVGCLGGCLVLVLVGAVFGVGLAGLIFTGLKSSGPYSQALELARQNREVVEALGEPIEAGWLASGSISIVGSSGEADLSIPIHGPRNRGTIYVVAEKRAGQWDFELLEVEIEGRSERVDLLSPEPDLQEIVGPDRARGGSLRTSRTMIVGFRGAGPAPIACIMPSSRLPRRTGGLRGE